MRSEHIQHTKYLILILILICLLFSCNRKTKTVVIQENVQENTIDDTSSMMIKVNRSLFSLPSPHQASLFMQQNGIKFNRELINETNNLSKYSTSFKKALNLGIFGTDLGYLNVYDQIPEGIKFFKTIKKLASDLGIYDAFDPDVLQSIEKNLSNKDSLLYYLSNIYQEANNYLNQNQRDGISALVISGGWIESLYILTQSTLLSGNYELRNRVGEQKYPLDNLIDLLSPFYYQSEEYAGLIDKLVDLAYEFDGVIYTYSYEKPVIDTINKTMIIKSESKVVISDYHLNVISEKISAIRNEIIN